MVPKVDTFAMDISEEVKRKEASLADIATASNEIGNEGDIDRPATSKPYFYFAIALVVLVVTIILLVGFMFMYGKELISGQDTSMPTNQVITENPTEKKGLLLSTLSETLHTAISFHIKNVEKKDAGYVITITTYTPVFAYMTKNENEYIDELFDVFYKDAKKVEQKKEELPTTTSTNATSSQAQGTTTISTSSSLLPVPTEEPVSPWSDVTISNTNMRLYTKDNKTVVYAFISEKKLIIAKTPNEVVTLRNAILK